MRILVVQESDWNGVGIHDTHHLMERLAVSGNDIRVIDFEIRWRQRDREVVIARRRILSGAHRVVNGAQIMIIRPTILKLPYLDYLSLVMTHWLEIRRQIREFKPDLIVGLGILNAKIAVNLARRNGIPFIFYLLDELHRLVPQKYLRNLAKVLESSNLQSADTVVVTSQALREYAISLGADIERIRVVPHGVDLGRFNKSNQRTRIREEYHLHKNDVVLFFMGWLYEFSGLDILARKLIESSASNMKLMIVGKGELWSRLHEIAEEGGAAGRVILVGWKEYSEIPDLISAADICILPSRKVKLMENIVPIKILEYMAAGKPVIVSNVPGVRKEFGDDSGVLYADSCTEMLRLSKELAISESLKAYGDQARFRVAQNDWSMILERFKAVIEETGEMVSGVIR